MFISIEGIDGAGKTSVAKELAHKLGFEYSGQKALSTHMCIDDNLYLGYCHTYRNAVRGDPTSMFMLYGLSCFLSGQKADVVCDRHLPTVYFWYGNDNSLLIADVIYKISSKPDITIVLDVNVETATQRIQEKLDSKKISEVQAKRDFEKAINAEMFISKIEPFLNKFELSYTIIDANTKSIAEIVNEILELIDTVMQQSKLR